jgi:ADP-heptose:LPS heptosyltransferase
VPDANLHAVERNWLAAAALGAGDGEKCFRLHVDQAARLWVAERLQDCPRPWLAVAPGARWRTKRWPPEHFADLARRAQRKFGGTALFVGSGEDLPLAEAASRLLDSNSRIFAGGTSLPQLTALLNEADVMLANDTGPLHLAAALGRPVVAPYTCTQVRRNGPFGQAARTAEADVWCQGSYRKHCRRLECLDALKPDQLWPILHEILRTWQHRRLSA